MTSPEQNYFAHFAMRYPGNSVYRSGLVDTLVTHANMRRVLEFSNASKAPKNSAKQEFIV